MRKQKMNSPAHKSTTILASVLTLAGLSGSVVAQDAIVIDNKGFVGVGTASPAVKLHVSDPTAAQILVQNTGATAERVPFVLINNGKTRFLIVNSGNAWTFDNDGAFFNISKVGTGFNEFQVGQNGDGFFRGDVYSKGIKLTSSRKTKTDIAPVEPRTILEQLTSLQVSTWRFQQDDSNRMHIGPMAEDFQQAFGMGDGRHIDVIDASGVALAAIRGLYQMVREKDAEITTLQEQLGQQQMRLDALEAQLAGVIERQAQADAVASARFALRSR